MSDIKALIARVRHTYGSRGGGDFAQNVAEFDQMLAAALEAAQQTPADIPFVLRRAMHHQLSPVLGRARLTPETDPGEQWDAAVEATIAEVLESLQQTPAVDREALAAEIHERFNMARGRGGVAPAALAEQILASGILQDAAEVEARGLEKAAEEWERMVLREKPPVRGYLFLRARAEKVRESN